MFSSTINIVVIALTVLALVGVAVAFSAWRHVVRMERETDEAGTGLSSAA